MDHISEMQEAILKAPTTGLDALRIAHQPMGVRALLELTGDVNSLAGRVQNSHHLARVSAPHLHGGNSRTDWLRIGRTPNTSRNLC